MRFRAWVSPSRSDEPFAKFFRDRGTHLAAMIAYFALLSFVPLIFLALALLGLADQAGRVELPRPRAQADVPGHVGRPDRATTSTRCRTTPPRSASSAASSCSGRRSRSSACSSPRSTSSTTGRTAAFLHGKALAVVLLLGLARDAVLRPARRIARLPSAQGPTRQAFVVEPATSPTRSRSLISTVGAFVFLFAVVLLAHQRELTAARRAAGRARRDGCAGGDVPGLPLYLRVVLGLAGAAGVRRARRSCSSGST